MIYLDNAATTFPKPEAVYNSMMDCMKNYCANPGRAGHKLAMKSAREIYDARENIAKLFNIDNPMNVVFTNNATESLNLAIKGVVDSGDHIITTSMEHNSVIRPIKALEKLGIENTIVQCDKEGFLDIRKNPLYLTNHARERMYERMGIRESYRMDELAFEAYQFGKSKLQLMKSERGIIEEKEQEYGDSIILIYRGYCYVFTENNGLKTVYKNDRVRA